MHRVPRHNLVAVVSRARRARWPRLAITALGTLSGCAAAPPPVTPLPVAPQAAVREGAPQGPATARFRGGDSVEETAARTPSPAEQLPPWIDQSVQLRTWCNDLGKAFCTHCQRDTYATCMTAFLPACYAQRSPNMVTDRTARHVLRCSQALTGASCAQVSRGELPVVCRAVR